MACSMPALTWKKPSLERCPGEEARVARIVVAQEQVRRVGVGAGDDHGGHAEHICGQARRHQLVDGLAGRDQDLAAEVAAFLGGR